MRLLYRRLAQLQAYRLAGRWPLRDVQADWSVVGPRGCPSGAIGPSRSAEQWVLASGKSSQVKLSTLGSSPPLNGCDGVKDVFSSH